MSIKSQYEVVALLAKAHDAASRLKAIQSSQQHTELGELSGKYGKSAYYSRWQAIIALTATLGIICLCTSSSSIIGARTTPLCRWINNNTLKDILSTVGKNGGEIGRIVQDLTLAPEKSKVDGAANILNTKISGQQGQGASSAKTAEDELRQTLSSIAQAYQRAIAASAA